MTHELEKRFDKVNTTGTVLLGAFSLLSAFFLYELEKTKEEKRLSDDRSELVTRDGRGETSTIVVVGNSANGEHFAKQLGPHLEEYGPAHFIVYPKRGFSADSVGEKFLEATEKSGGRPQTVICFSMGQMVVNYLFSKEGFVDQAGDIDMLISDSGVTKISNLQPSTHRLLNIGARVPVTSSIAKLYRYFRMNHKGKMLEHDEEVSDEDALAHTLSTNMTSLYANSPQWRFMLHSAILPDGALADVGAKIPHKYYLSSKFDPVVDVYKSFKDQDALYGGGWEHIISPRRPHEGHAAGAEHPRDFRELLGKFSTRWHRSEQSDLIYPEGFETAS